MRGYPPFQPHHCSARCVKVPNLFGHFFCSFGNVAQMLVQPVSPSPASACCNCVTCCVAGRTHVFLYTPSPLSRHRGPPLLSASIFTIFSVGLAIADQRTWAHVTDGGRIRFLSFSYPGIYVASPFLLLMHKYSIDLANSTISPLVPSPGGRLWQEHSLWFGCRNTFLWMGRRN